MLNDPITENTTVRIMPDTHFGAGATIGTTIKLSDNKDEWKIAPQVVGVDLSCGMMSYRIKEKDIDLAKLDTVVNSVVPAGSRIHAKPQHSKDVEYMIDQLTYDIPQKTIITSLLELWVVAITSSNLPKTKQAIIG